MNKNDQCKRHGNGVSAAAMWSPRVRGLYMAEFIIFASPAIFMLGYVAGLALVASSQYFVISVWSAFRHGGVENTQRIVGSAMGVSFAVISISALWLFLRLSLYYVRGKRTAPLRARQRYWRGVVCALFPLVLLFYGIFVSVVAETLRPALPFLSFCLTILFPVAHLGFALRAADASPSP